MKHQLIAPKQGLGNKMIFSEDDCKQFEKIKEFLAGGATSVPEAIRLMKGNLRPQEALDLYEKAQEKFQVAQTQIMILNKKVVELRRSGSWFNRIVDWFKDKFSFLRKGEREQETQ